MSFTYFYLAVIFIFSFGRYFHYQPIFSLAVTFIFFFGRYFNIFLWPLFSLSAYSALLRFVYQRRGIFFHSRRHSNWTWLRNIGPAFPWDILEPHVRSTDYQPLSHPNAFTGSNKIVRKAIILSRRFSANIRFV